MDSTLKTAAKRQRQHNKTPETNSIFCPLHSLLEVLPVRSEVCK